MVNIAPARFSPPETSLHIVLMWLSLPADISYENKLLFLIEF